MIKKNILIIIILLIGIFFRLFKLESLPDSYTPDEVAQAYTAYSLLQTGKDEWGHSWPLSLQSFGDFKPPLQTYLIIPFVKLFGLRPIAFRLPNAIMSSAAILVTYLLAFKLLKNKTVAIMSALLLSVSPWHLPMSRLALEANIPIFLIPLSLLLLPNKKYVLAGIILGLSTFSYHSAKIFVPLMLVLTNLFILRQHPSTKKNMFTITVVIFLLLNFFTGQNNSRTSDIIISNPTDSWQSVSATRFQISQNGLPDIITRLFKNKLTYISTTFTKNYLSYFSPQFLITNGAGEQTYGMIPDFGVIGLACFIGLIFAIVTVRSAKQKRYIYFLLGLIVISVIPASLSKGYLSANRASVMMPYIQIVSAYGLYQLFKKFRPIAIPMIVIFAYTTINFLITYFYSANNILAESMLYGRQQSFEIINQYPSDMSIIYSRKLSEPQAYTMFFMQIDPRLVQSQTPDWLRYQQQDLSFVDQLGQYDLENFTFKEISYPEDISQPNTLIIGKPEEFPVDQIADHIIYFPSDNQNKPAIYIYNTNLHQ